MVLNGSHGRNPTLIIINHTVTYRLKQSLVSTYFGRWGGNWVAEDAAIVSLCLETQVDIAFHACDCCSHHGRRNCNSCRNDTHQIGRHWVNVAKYTILNCLYVNMY
jgi:hypothetical protein